MEGKAVVEMPSVCTGRDVVGIAETGCGKTAAYIVPLLHRLLQSREAGEEPVSNRKVKVLPYPSPATG